ncbi:MAG: DNA repair protein RadA [Chloroflexota bacterium]
MPKARKSIYICQQCGAQSPRWAGRCPHCDAWNSLVETVAPSENGPRGLGVATSGHSQPQSLAHVTSSDFPRLQVPIGEFNRVLGGGIVPGSLVLIGGDPGIGKSTLLLQVSAQLAGGERPVLYVSGEESVQQIKMRADRLDASREQLLVLSETNLETIAQQVQEIRPRLVVVDSIQTVYLDDLESSAGSIGQLRECTARLMRLAKSTHVPIFLVGHVTKEGAIAGPRALEHIVDTVLYLEGERFHSYRLLRGVKNRFGSTNEVGVFEMRGEGMVEVHNPSEAFLAERSAGSTGSAVVVTLEGTRPLLVEVQALTTTTSFGLPRRTANGIESSRLLMLTAVLTKRVGLALSNQDIYINVVGGLKIGEPAADVGVALAIASSFGDRVVPADLTAIGEVGLAGELRTVSQVERRLAEAANLGFRRCLLPAALARRPLQTNGVELIGVGSLAAALEAALE